VPVDRDQHSGGGGSAAPPPGSNLVGAGVPGDVVAGDVESQSHDSQSHPQAPAAPPPASSSSAAAAAAADQRADDESESGVREAHLGTILAVAPPTQGKLLPDTETIASAADTEIDASVKARQGAPVLLGSGDASTESHAPTSTPGRAEEPLLPGSPPPGSPAAVAVPEVEEDGNAAPVSDFLACIRSPCLRHCVHGAPIGGGGARGS
jgi:hypothetical protein